MAEPALLLFVGVLVVAVIATHHGAMKINEEKLKAERNCANLFDELHKYKQEISKLKEENSKIQELEAQLKQRGEYEQALKDIHDLREELETRRSEKMHWNEIHVKLQEREEYELLLKENYRLQSELNSNALDALDTKKENKSLMAKIQEIHESLKKKEAEMHGAILVGVEFDDMPALT